MSACMPSISRRVRPVTLQEPNNGLMWVSIRLQSIWSVDVLIGRRLRPRIRPALVSSKYQSQTSPTRYPDLCGVAFRRRVFALGHGGEFLCALGRAQPRAPAPRTGRAQVGEFDPRHFDIGSGRSSPREGLTRTPKPLSSESHPNTSRPACGSSASTLRFVIFAMYVPALSLSFDGGSHSASPALRVEAGEARGKHEEESRRLGVGYASVGRRQ